MPRSARARSAQVERWHPFDLRSGQACRLMWPMALTFGRGASRRPPSSWASEWRTRQCCEGWHSPSSWARRARGS